MQQIKIDSISQNAVQSGTKIVFVSGKTKYQFYEFKKDGDNTKAFEQYKKFGFKVGDIVTAEVAEEQKSFVNEEKKKVNYTQRTILYFEEIAGNSVALRETSPVPQKPVKTESIAPKKDDCGGHCSHVDTILAVLRKAELQPKEEEVKTDDLPW